MTTTTEDQDEQLRRRITRLEERVTRVEDKADLALHLARHQLTISATSWLDQPAKWGHCSCGEWDLRAKDVDLVAELHHQHRDDFEMPALF